MCAAIYVPDRGGKVARGKMGSATKVELAVFVSLTVRRAGGGDESVESASSLASVMGCVHGGRTAACWLGGFIHCCATPAGLPQPPSPTPSVADAADPSSADSHGSERFTGVITLRLAHAKSGSTVTASSGGRRPKTEPSMAGWTCRTQRAEGPVARV